jgi:hypothetical protein
VHYLADHYNSRQVTGESVASINRPFTLSRKVPFSLDPFPVIEWPYVPIKKGSWLGIYGRPIAEDAYGRFIIEVTTYGV